MTELRSSVEAIVDTMERGETRPVLVNFQNSRTRQALLGAAKVAQADMFGALPEAVQEAPEGAGEAESTVDAIDREGLLLGLRNENAINIGRFGEALGASDIEAVSALRASEAGDLWLSGAFQAEMDRETLAGLADQTDTIGSVVLDAVINEPETATLERQAEIDRAVWGLSYIDAPEAWIMGTRGRNVRVSVIDTGIADHEALANVALSAEARFDFSTGQARLIGFVNVPNRSDRGAGVGHGTHVAGTIAGKRVGIAPDATLLSASVFDRGKTTTSAVIQAMQWSVANRADIINLSLGAFDRSVWLGNYDDTQTGLGATHDTYNAAIMNALRAGTLVVAAIGNSGMGTSGTPGSCVSSLSVGAMAIDGRCAGFSGGGVLSYYNNGQLSSYYMKPDLSAPGVAVKSADRFGTYSTISGTSMATPCVAGVAALVLSDSSFIRSLPNPHYRSEMLKLVLKYSATKDLGEHGMDTRYGMGVINAQDAIAMGRDTARLDRIFTNLMNAGVFDGPI